MKFRLHCLGTGDGASGSGRNHAAFLYRFGTASLLVDCGEPVERALDALKLGPEIPGAILLSHGHADHVGGLFMLLQGLWISGRRKRLPIHLPGRLVPALRGLLEAGCVFEQMFEFRIDWKPLPAGRVFRAGGARVTALRNTHLERTRLEFPEKPAAAFLSCSFLIESGGLRIAHSADLGSPADLEPLLRRPVDLLVCELAHFTPEELFRQLRGRPVGRVVFVHLARHYWEDLARVRRLARASLGGIPHRFARDGDVIEL
ncbi:MAG: MBL fold metallo-hydrolase [Verrucomicrobiota bacterium]